MGKFKEHPDIPESLSEEAKSFLLRSNHVCVCLMFTCVCVLCVHVYLVGMYVHLMCVLCVCVFMFV